MLNDSVIKNLYSKTLSILIIIFNNILEVFKFMNFCQQKP